MEYTVDYIWDKGSRSINEDSLAILSLTLGRTPFLFAVVADGIGGLSEGENASSYLVNQLRNSVWNYTRSAHRINLRQLHKLIERELFRAHHAISSYGVNKGINLGTTVSLICLHNAMGFILHTGDCRISSGGKTLTNSHTDNKGRLIRCIGAGHYFFPQHKKLKIKKGEQIILSSDGYYLNNSGDNKSAIIIDIS